MISVRERSNCSAWVPRVVEPHPVCALCCFWHLFRYLVIYFICLHMNSVQLVALFRVLLRLLCATSRMVSVARFAFAVIYSHFRSQSLNNFTFMLPFKVAPPTASGDECFWKQRQGQ